MVGAGDDGGDAEAEERSRDAFELRRDLAAAILRAEDAEHHLASASDKRSGGVAPFLEIAAEEVQRAERVMRALFRNASDAMLLLNDDGLYVDVNPAACALLRMTKGTLLRKGIASHATDPDLATAAFQTMKEVGFARGVLSITRADGVGRTVDYALTANIGAHLHLSVVRDITDEAVAAASLARTESALRQTDARFRAMVDKNLESIVLFSGDGRILFASRRSSELIGAPVEGLLGQSALDWVFEEDLASFDGALSELFSKGSAALEFRVRHRDGTVRWLEAVATNLLGDADVAAVIANVRDVTSRHAELRERERLVESLSFERSRLGLLLQKAPAFIAVLRGDRHVFELANEAYAAMAGYGVLIGRPIGEAILGVRATGFVEVLDRVLATGEPYVRKSVASHLPRGPRGETGARFVNVMVQALFEADGTRSGVFLHGVDVTEETLAQRRIQAQFDGIPVPTYAWQRVEATDLDASAGAEAHASPRPDFALFDYNEAALSVTGGGVARYKGQTARAIFGEAHRVPFDLEECLREGQTFQREFDQWMETTRAQKRYVVTYSFVPPNVVLAHTEDVTERRKLEEQLRQGQKMDAVGRLAGGIAHDFNNLMSVVLSYTTLAMNDLTPDHPLYADLGEINRAGERAVELTRQLLAFSRQQVLQPRVMSISETLRAIDRMLRRLVREDIDLSVVPLARAHVDADPGQIEQVMMNLVINARDAMPDGGRLTVESSDVALTETLVTEPTSTAPGQYVLLLVSDTGVGMDEATRARIFEPFFTTKTQGKGTGLGLATVFGIVQQSGGAIHVVTELGVGTTFRIFFPVARGGEAAKPFSIPVPLSAGGAETILVVEDEAPLRALAIKVLRRVGYDVLEAEDGESALVVASGFAGHIHLLLTDVVMPKVNGRVLSDRLSALRPDLKTLFMSGYTDDAAVIDRVVASKTAFLQKPITPDVLLKKVRAVLDGKD